MSALRPEIAEASPTGRSAVSRTRSRITNGSISLEGIDGRSRRARRFRDISCAIAQDLGGEARLSEAQRQLIRRAAGLSVVIEQNEAALINGATLNTEEWVRLTNSLCRVLNLLGLKRRAATVPSLTELLAETTEGTAATAA